MENSTLNLPNLILELSMTVENNSNSIHEQISDILTTFFAKPKTNSKMLVKKSALLHSFLDSFRALKDFEIHQELIKILIQITQVKFGTRKIIEFSGTEAVLESISLFTDAIPENFILHFILLAKLSEKDAKFSTKFRCFHLIPFLIENLKYFSTNWDRLLPVLTVFHRCAVSPTTCIVMRKNFAMKALIHLLDTATCPLHPIFSICLESIRLLLKNKGILLSSSYQFCVNGLIRFYQILSQDSQNVNEIFAVLSLFKEISNNPRGYSVISSSKLFGILSETLVNIREVYTESVVRNKFVKLNLELIQCFVRKKVILYPNQIVFTPSDEFRNQLPLQNRNFTPISEEYHIIDKLNLFSDIAPQKLRNFTLNIRSLIDLEYLLPYSYEQEYMMNELLEEIYFLPQIREQINSEISQFCEKLSKNPNYNAYTNESYSISPKFHTFTNPDIYECSQCIHEKEEDLTISVALDKLHLIENPGNSEEIVIFSNELAFIDPLLNLDRKPVHTAVFNTNHLHFSAAFESSNLLKATMVNNVTYNLTLRPDTNTNRHIQWFLFNVKNMQTKFVYTFNIINCDKNNSQFNNGMQPLLLSRKSNRGWLRTGSMISYGESDFLSKNSAKLYTLTFKIEFPFENDDCYIAYHYPYTYTDLLEDIQIWSKPFYNNIYFRVDTLCHTYSRLPCPLLTITDGDSAVFNKKYVVLTSRVHPGEANASWIMKSIIDFLLSSQHLAIDLRSKFVFKIVPMLNPDGVAYGNTRCNVLGFDLNRQWLDPSPNLHPTIFYTKKMMEKLINFGRKPVLFCDFHGHSRKKDVFMYGCNSESKIETILPTLFAENYTGFDLNSCSYGIEKSKLRCGRVVVGTNLDIPCAYTLESTFCGYSEGVKSDFQVTLNDFEEIGYNFLKSLQDFFGVLSDKDTLL